MNLGILVTALRKGASVTNPTPFKWAGAAVAAALVALKAAQAAGYLRELDDEVVIELVMAAALLWAHVATTDKIGLLPARHHPEPPAAAPERVRDQPVSPGAATPVRDPRRGGFPDGPFFDH